jgi:hypothetical protein
MNKIIICLSLLVTLSISACDTYKNHGGDDVISSGFDCTDSAKHNSACPPSSFNVAKTSGEDKKEDKKIEPEGPIYAKISVN